MTQPPGFRHPAHRPRGKPWLELSWQPDIQKPYLERTEPLPSPWTFECDAELMAITQLDSYERSLDAYKTRLVPQTSRSTYFGRGVKIPEVDGTPDCIPGTKIPLSKLKPQGVKKDIVLQRILPTGRAARFFRDDDPEPAPCHFHDHFANLRRQMTESSGYKDYSNRTIKLNFEKRYRNPEPPLIQYFNEEGSEVIVRPPGEAKPSESAAESSSSMDVPSKPLETSHPCCTDPEAPANLSADPNQTATEVVSKQEQQFGKKPEEALTLTWSHPRRQPKASSNNSFECPPLTNQIAWPKLGS